MRFQIVDVKKVFEFTELFKFMKNITQYVTFICKSSEVYIQLMDGSHVCLVDITFPAGFFLYGTDAPASPSGASGRSAARRESRSAL